MLEPPANASIIPETRLQGPRFHERRCQILLQRARRGYRQALRGDLDRVANPYDRATQ